MTKTFIAGNVLEYFATFYDVDGTPSDTDVVAFAYTWGEETVTIVHDDETEPALGHVWKVQPSVVGEDVTGQYGCRIDTKDIWGRLDATWTGTGSIQAVGDVSVIIAVPLAVAEETDD